MTNRMKRFLCMLLAVLMVLSTPVSVFAENSTNTTEQTKEVSITEALADAKAGETITLSADTEASVVVVPENVTLDLNGYKLKADYMACYGVLVDQSESNNGLLAVNANRFYIREDNAQLPVKTNEGYKFFEVTKFNKKFKDAESKYIFQPFVEEGAHEFLKKGAEASGVTINVRLSWNAGNSGKRSQDFVYSDEFVKNFFNSYVSSTGKYDRQLALTLKGAENFKDLSFTAVVAGANVVKCAEPIVINKTEEDVPADNNQLTEEMTIDNGKASAVVSMGTELEAGAKELTLTTEEMDATTSNIQLGDGEQMLSMDVHVNGVSKDNTVPVIITIDEIAPEFLNQGNIKLYHVENGETVEMTRVYSLEEADAHNEYYYDILTGTITMALASFSEVAVVADTSNAWEGNYDYSWYTNAVAPVDGEGTTEYTIANADQLAAFGAIVGGMAEGIERDDFAGQTVKLLADIDLGDKDNANESLIFYPIGYYYTVDKNEDGTTGDYYSTVYSFRGTFDGNGHTISNFYQNTWEIKGDYDGNYYKDAMGLFGYVNGTTTNEDGTVTLHGATVKNLTVDNFSSDGEFTPTGVIAAYATNATFENIAITNCNPRVYNTGNGGIVGIGGNDNDPDTYKLTFNNITIDNSNIISALWGSWDVACGGLVGMFRGKGHAYMTNCHVAAQIDVYNDVCGNYQYYWYRYSGMMVGTNKNMVTDKDGYTVPETSKFHAENCTVHFGDWNDYYYCELVANSLASYTHDHQFSRLEQIASLDEIKSGDTWTKTGNFLLISGDTKICYHIVKNADGTLKQHLHTDAGEENVNGKTVLKENNQIVYLPFNQLFTGYGWGVKHIPVYNGEGYAFEGITILDRTVANSVEKFEKIADVATIAVKEESEKTFTIKELFTAKDNLDLAINWDNIHVTVSSIGENSTVSGKYVAPENANKDNWGEGTLALTGNGAAEIRITDYYFCKPTILRISIITEEPSGSFVVKDYSSDEGASGETGKLLSKTVKDEILLGEIFEYSTKLTYSIRRDSLIENPENIEIVVIDCDTDKVITNHGLKINHDDWRESKISFYEVGQYKVMILAEGVEAAIADLDIVPAAKFVTKFTGNFLYRVGNQNSIALESLFEATGSLVEPISVSVVSQSGNVSVDGTYTNNTSAKNWNKETIDFNGIGIVTVSIKDSDEFCTPTELKLEVVDAVNATLATNATKNNVVLLNDCGFSSLEVSGGYTLYGNGFTMTCAKDSVAADFGYSFVTVNNGTLDNVQIDCPNFDYAALYKSNLAEPGNRSETDSSGKTRYYNAKSGVTVSGNSQILNSRISGGRAALNVTGGNVVVDNSRIELGAVATVLVGAANNLVLKDTTLVQKATPSTHDSSKTLMGFSVLYMCDSEGRATPTTIEGNFVQMAWASADDKKYVPSSGQAVIETVLAKKEYLHDLDGDGINESVNLGFAYFPEEIGKSVAEPVFNDNRTDNVQIPYSREEVDIFTSKAYVYSYSNLNKTAESFKNVDKYTANRYGDNITVIYEDSVDGLTYGKSLDADGWVYELNVDLDKASGYQVDFSKLSMMINGVLGDHLKVDGKEPSKLAVTAGGTMYTLTTMVNGKEYTARYKVTGIETTKESPSLVAANYEAGLCVASSYGGTWSGAAPALKGIQIKYWSVAEKQYKTISLSDYTPTTKGQINGTNTTWTYSPSNGDFTLTLTGGQVHSSNKVNAMPVVCDGTLYFVAATSKGLVNSGNSARAIPVTYTFKDNNNGDVLTISHTWSVAENKDAQYKYSDFCSGTLTKLEAAAGGGNCVTADTLITLADGSQVYVNSLVGEEEVLVWNLETGNFDSAPIMFVDSDLEAEVEIIHLYFSDGTDVKVVYEHGFWDYDLNKYVYLDRNAADYIGHEFAKQDGDKLSRVTLTDVVLETEITTAWSPVTEGHLCYFVNGMLSMPGGVGGLFNIFDVDAKTMTYDYEAMAQDIEIYGLFTYEELNSIEPLSEEMFEAAGGAYLKISIGKGNMTLDDLIYMIQRYSKYFD